MIGKPISRQEAIQHAMSILEEAEEGRRKCAEEEARIGYQYEEEEKTEIRNVPGMGRGVFATTTIPKDTVIEEVPVILLEAGSISDPSFNCYPMEWTESHDCIALGEMNLLNHSENSNCRIENNYDNLTKTLIVKRDISPGEQLTINYAYSLWFSPVSI